MERACSAPPGFLSECPSLHSRHGKPLSAFQLTAEGAEQRPCPSVYLWPRLGVNRASVQPPPLSRPSGETTSTPPSLCLLSLSL